MINMKWALPLIILASFQASADRVTCLEVGPLTQVPDDVCETISDAAYACFAKLNFEFTRVNDSTRAEVIADYEREVKRLQDQYIPALKSIGESPRTCLNETGKVEVAIEEMQKDLDVLKGIRKPKSKR